MICNVWVESFIKVVVYENIFTHTKTLLYISLINFKVKIDKFEDNKWMNWWKLHKLG